VILEVPAASDKASLYGQIVDHWQITIADIGPSGIDEGKGGKILLTPPGYSDPIPDGYIELKSPSYRVAFAFRSVPSPTGSTEQAYAYTQKLKMYYLSELPNPQSTHFIDPINMRFASLPHYDEKWFEHLYAIISIENVYPRDKVMMGMLASLGIEKGKPYDPDPKVLKAMRQGVVDAYYFMQQRFLDLNDPAKFWWPGKYWANPLLCDANREFVYEYADAWIAITLEPTIHRRSVRNRQPNICSDWLTRTVMSFRLAKPTRLRCPLRFRSSSFGR